SGLLHDARGTPPGRPRRGDRLGADAGHEADLGPDARTLPAVRSRPRSGGARGPVGRRRRRTRARAPACRVASGGAGAGERAGGARVRGALAGAGVRGLSGERRGRGPDVQRPRAQRAVVSVGDTPARGSSTAERRLHTIWPTPPAVGAYRSGRLRTEAP